MEILIERPSGKNANRAARPLFSTPSGIGWFCFGLAMAVLLSRESRIITDTGALSVRIGSFPSWVLLVTAGLLFVRHRKRMKAYAARLTAAGRQDLLSFVEFSEDGVCLGVRDVWQNGYQWIAISGWRETRTGLELHCGGKQVRLDLPDVDPAKRSDIQRLLTDKVGSSETAGRGRRLTG
jgi:hypothetical protein